MEFNITNFVIISLVTVFSFGWIKDICIIEKKTFYLFIGIFYYLICGVTGFLFSTNTYLIYYCVYTFAFGSALYITRNWTIYLDFLHKQSFTIFAEQNSSKFVKFFFLIQICSLIYPQNKLLNLFLLSSPDVETALENSLEHSVWDSLLYLSSLFFYIGLSCYIDRPKKIIILLLLSTWLSYASSSYLSRGAIVRILVVIFLLMYFKYPQKRKVLLVAASITSVFLVSFLVSYMYWRMGNEFQMIDLSLAIEKIAEIELSFSKPFDDVVAHNKNQILQYLWWFVSMPLPGFLKFDSANMEINQSYNKDILGVEPGDIGFFITLPGVVIEGVYLFGNQMYMIHGIIFAIVCNIIINVFRENKLFYILLIYYIINIPFGAIRGGTQGLYIYTNKLIPIAILILYILYKISFYYGKKKGAICCHSRHVY